MLSIYKYAIPVNDSIELEMPMGTEILTVQMQGGCPQLWALVNPNLEKSVRYFRLAGTGHMIANGENLSYINTFQLENGSLVFHLFEILNSRLK